MNEEDVAGFEDPGVVREEAEDDSNEEALEVVAPVIRVVESVVELPHEFCGRDVCGVLVTEGPAFHAEDETEVLDVLREVGEGEARGSLFVEVLEFEGLEVAEQEEPGSFAFRECVEILEGLLACFGQAASGAFLLNKEHTWPEQVDVSVSVVQLRDVCLVPSDASSADVEDLEELVVEALGVLLLVGGVVPLVRERGGAGADFIP